MAMNHNGLTDAEDERLTILAEEASEVIQVIQKIKRFGYNSKHPTSGVSNKQLLETELGDLDSILRRMALETDVDVESISKYSKMKDISRRPYTYYQRDSLGKIKA